MIHVKIHPDLAKANPDAQLDLPASAVADGGGPGPLKVGQTRGVHPHVVLIQRALRRRDIIETKPLTSKE